jgi:undecaprenyl diphosphate synthase
MSVKPPPHPSGAVPPDLAAPARPAHIAVVMDGNGRWANARGLTRTEGHRAGEAALVEVVAGAVEAGVSWLSVYAFSTENWRRSPSEVRFLMGYSRRVLRARRDLFHSWGVRVVWSGQTARLWPSVIRELREAETLTAANTGLTLNLCVNYGGRAEIAEAARRLAQLVAAGQMAADDVDEARLSGLLGQRPGDPERTSVQVPDVDLFVRTSGERRTSNFLLWQAAYAELVFVDELWPDVDRRVLWRAIEEYAGRGRRFGGAVDQPR